MKTKDYQEGFLHQDERNWRRLRRNLRGFQEILRILVEFDERRLRQLRREPSALHLLRKALCVCDSHELRVYLLHRGGYLYHVAASFFHAQGRLATVWIHEDGIRAEREIYAEQKDHPVHRILCMSDLYERDSESMTEEYYDEDIGYLEGLRFD